MSKAQRKDMHGPVTESELRTHLTRIVERACEVSDHDRDDALKEAESRYYLDAEVARRMMPIVVRDYLKHLIRLEISDERQRLIAESKGVEDVPHFGGHPQRVAQSPIAPSRPFSISDHAERRLVAAQVPLDNLFAYQLTGGKRLGMATALDLAREAEVCGTIEQQAGRKRKLWLSLRKRLAEAGPEKRLDEVMEPGALRDQFVIHGLAVA